MLLYMIFDLLLSITAQEVAMKRELRSWKWSSVPAMTVFLRTYSEISIHYLSGLVGLGSYYLRSRYPNELHDTLLQHYPTPSRSDLAFNTVFILFGIFI